MKVTMAPLRGNSQGKKDSRVHDHQISSSCSGSEVLLKQTNDCMASMMLLCSAYSKGRQQIMFQTVFPSTKTPTLTQTIWLWSV